MRAPVSEVLHLAQRAHESRKILEVAEEAEHGRQRVRHDEREAQMYRAAARADATQRLAHGPARGDADEREAGERGERSRRGAARTGADQDAARGAEQQ